MGDRYFLGEKMLKTTFSGHTILGALLMNAPHSTGLTRSGKKLPIRERFRAIGVRMKMPNEFSETAGGVV